MANQTATTLPPDPLESGLQDFARRLRTGTLTAEAATRAYLSRIQTLDAKLGAYEYVATEAALHQARAMDALLAAGVDLGPLMGVPIAVKDLFAVNGMPVTAGSRVPVEDIVSAEGSFVHRLKQAGCVLLGTTKTVEFAFGAAGINSVRGTPWNPWDAERHRLPGGSSSGSAVAVAARLCAFAIGTDTGGSVRVPAALCGIFGLKTTVGLWPTDGVFPLSTTLDSIGLLTRHAEDAATAFAALTPTAAPVAEIPTRGLRLGRIRGYMDQNIDPEVSSSFEAAVSDLEGAGVEIEDVDLPEAAEREWIVPILLGSEVLATLGRDRFEAWREHIDPVVAARIANVLETTADEYVRARRRQQALAAMAATRLSRVDGWISPTCAVAPLPVNRFDKLEDGVALSKRITQCTQPGNVFGLCGANIPLMPSGGLPVGFQLLCAPHMEPYTLAVARALQACTRVPRLPDVQALLSG